MGLRGTLSEAPLKKSKIRLLSGLKLRDKFMDNVKWIT
jgi:hypothetical protein